MAMNAMPLLAGIAAKNFLKASKPPAEAPMAITGKRGSKGGSAELASGLAAGFSIVPGSGSPADGRPASSIPGPGKGPFFVDLRAGFLLGLFAATAILSAQEMERQMTVGAGHFISGRASSSVPCPCLATRGATGI
jgi:hypothetical protein